MILKTPVPTTGQKDFLTWLEANVICLGKRAVTNKANRKVIKTETNLKKMIMGIKAPVKPSAAVFLEILRSTRDEARLFSAMLKMRLQNAGGK